VPFEAALGVSASFLRVVRTAGLPAELKKNRKVGLKQKKHFFCHNGGRNDLESG
jgi:hypothetical protein